MIHWSTVARGLRELLFPPGEPFLRSFGLDIICVPGRREACAANFKVTPSIFGAERGRLQIAEVRLVIDN